MHAIVLASHWQCVLLLNQTLFVPSCDNLPPDAPFQCNSCDGGEVR